MAKFGTAYIDIEGDFSTLERQIRSLNFKQKFKTIGDDADKGISPGLDKVSKRTKTTGKDVDDLGGHVSELDRMLAHAGGSASGLAAGMSLVKPAALITGAGLAAQALSALAGGAIATGSALAPLTGLAGAYAVGMTAAAQASGVFKLATSGVSDAVSGDAAAMAKLPPAAQAFTKSLIALKPELDALKQNASQGFFAGASQGLTAALGSFGAVKKVVGETSGVLGTLAQRAGELVGSKGFGKDIELVGGRNAKVIEHLGTAAISGADALRHILVAAGPLTEWLAGLAQSFAATVASQAKAGRESGRLAGFFDKTRAVLERLGGIVAPLATAFWNIGKAATPLGNDILAALGKAAQGFAAWTKSIGGQNALRQYFADAKAPLFALGKLIDDVVKVFFRLGSGDQIAPLLDTIRTQLLPVFENVLRTTTAAFGPHLIEALTQVLRLFGAMAGSSGPLSVFVDLVGTAARVMADLLTNNPVLQTMVVTFAGLASVFKAVKLFGFVSGISAMSKGLAGAATAYRSLAAGATVATVAQERGTAATILARIAMVAQAAIAQARLIPMYAQIVASLIAQRVAILAGAVAAGAAALATNAMAGAQALLNIVLDANPIILVVAGLAALTAGLILAYQHSATFRNIVDELWHAAEAAFAGIKTAAEYGLLGPVGVIITRWGDIKTAFTDVFGAVETIVTTGAGVVSTLLTGMASAMDVIWTGIKSAADLAWAGIQAAITAPLAAAQAVIGVITGSDGILHGIGSALAGAWTAIKTAADIAWAGIKTAITAPLQAAQAVIGLVGGKDGILHDIGDALDGAWGIIKTGAEKGWGAIKDAVTAPLHAAQDAIGKVDGKDGILHDIAEALTGAWDHMTKGVGGFAGKIKDGIESAFKGAANLIIDFINIIIKAINLIPGVPNIKPMAHIGDDSGGGAVGNAISSAGKAPGFARGGVLPAMHTGVGGRVTRPLAIVGEEAPRHPEYVIPLNPANRGRALGLHAAAGRELGIPGYDIGGVIGGIGNAIGGAVSGAAGAVGSVVDVAAELLSKGANFILDKLPGVGSLPDWLEGAGTYTLGKVTSWIKDKVASVISSLIPGLAPGTDAPAAQRISAMVKAMNAIDAQHFPYVYGGGHGGFAGPYDCSGLVSAILHAGGFLGSPMTTDGLKVFGEAGDGKNITIGVRGTTGANAHTMMKIGGKYLESGGGHGAAWTGGWDGNFPIHRHPSGFAQGGILTKKDLEDVFDPKVVGWGLARGGVISAPFVGSYLTGGVAPADGLAYVHKGETISPAGPAPVIEVHTYIGERELTEITRTEIRERDRDKSRTYMAGVK